VRCVVSVEILPIATQQCRKATCTTSPEQIEVMKLEGYRKPMCNKHVHSIMTRSSRFHCLTGVINKPTTDTVVDITSTPTTCSGEIFYVYNVTLGATCYDKSMYQISSLRVHPLRSYEWRCKMQKMGRFGVVRGHWTSWAMPPFNRAHMTSYSTLID